MFPTPKIFEKVARAMLNLPVDTGKETTQEEKATFRHNIGVSFVVCSTVWELIDPLKNISVRAKPKHLLWTLVYLKVYASEFALLNIIKCKQRCTFRNWVKKFLVAIDGSFAKIIRLSNRFKKWDGRTSSLITVDGTDCRIREQWPYSPVWWSHKFNGPGCKYEIGICIQTADIVWVSGPFPCALSDSQIFKDGLAKKMFPGETVEVDNGYKSKDELMHVFRNPATAKTRRDKKLKSRARGRHENINGRFKYFGILNGTFRGTLEFHGIITRAIAVLLQIGFENGDRLYEIEFDCNYD